MTADDVPDVNSEHDFQDVNANENSDGENSVQRSESGISLDGESDISPDSDSDIFFDSASDDSLDNVETPLYDGGPISMVHSLLAILTFTSAQSVRALLK